MSENNWIQLHSEGRVGHLRPFGSANKIKTIGGSTQTRSGGLYNCDICAYEREGDPWELRGAKSITAACEWTGPGARI